MACVGIIIMEIILIATNFIISIACFCDRRKHLCFACVGAFILLDVCVRLCVNVEARDEIKYVRSSNPAGAIKIAIVPEIRALN